MALTAASPEGPESAAPIVEVRDLVKRYPKRKKEALKAVDGVSFTVRRGEILGLLGPNGAGKTTTIKLVCGLLQADAGSVLVNGYDTRRERLKALRHISAVLEGNRNLYWRLTVRENLEYFAGNRGRSRREAKEQIDGLLEGFRLQDKAGELVNNLSRGMQQKLAVAVAMLAGTEVVLLDEPTLGLDVETGYEVRELLRQIALEGRTVIVSTHDMPVVQDLCERAVIISAGRVVVDDKVSNLLRLFETRAYEIRLGRPLGAEQRRLLALRFPACSGHDFTLDLLLKVTLEQDTDIYALMDILRRNHTPVESIDRTSINFEAVFRQLVRGDNRVLS
ncbi:MAG: ABC transporter ATP-binding protein [Deinococcota bacterium]|nr:ABC transporter ATP-binding protein [Deinococcota bacterium]